MKFKSDIEVQAGIKDSSGNQGTSGQVLSSNGTTVSWIPAGSSVARDVQNQVKAGVAINKGQAVYVTGADGTNIIVGKASNTSEATSSKTLGLLNATVNTNGTADVVQIGRLAGLNTIGANAGDPVWLGQDGNLIYGLTNKPYAPLHLVFIGIVTRVNANNGEIFVNVQNGFELQELHNVDLETNVPINGDVLGYDGTLWVNKTIAEWLGYTPANDANVVHITGTETITGAKTFTGEFKTTVPSLTGAQTKISAIDGISDGYVIDVDVDDNMSHTFNRGDGQPAIFIAPNGFVAIGGTSPGVKLQVSGDIVGGNLFFSGGSISPIGGFPLLMKTSGVTRLSVTNTGLLVTGQASTSYSSDSAVTGTKTLDFNSGNIAFYTLTGSTTITLSNAIAGAVYTIRLTQGGSGSYTVTWDPVVKWGGGTTPTLSTAVGAIDIVTLLYDGTNFYGNIVKNFA